MGCYIWYSEDRAAASCGNFILFDVTLYYLCASKGHSDLCDIVYVVLHENQLTHTDLKPENILFVHSDYDIVPGPKRPYGKKVYHCSLNHITSSLCVRAFCPPILRRSLPWALSKWVMKSSQFMAKSCSAACELLQQRCIG